MFERLKAEDLVAITIIILSYLAIYMGKDHFIPLVLTTIVGYYFGTRVEINRKDKVKTIQDERT